MSSLARYLAVLVCLFQPFRLMEGASVLNGKEPFGIIYQNSTLNCTDSGYISTSGFVFAKGGSTVLTHTGEVTPKLKYSATRNAGFIEIIIHNTSVTDEDNYTCIAGFGGQSGPYTFWVEMPISDVTATRYTSGFGYRKTIHIKLDGLYPSPFAVTVRDGTKLLTGTTSIKQNDLFFDFEWTSTDTFPPGTYDLTVEGTTRRPSKNVIEKLTIPGDTYNTTTPMVPTPTTQQSNTTETTSFESATTTSGNTSLTSCNLTSDLGKVGAIIGGSVGGYVFVIIFTPGVMYCWPGRR